MFICWPLKTEGMGGLSGVLAYSSLPISAVNPDAIGSSDR